MKHYPSARSAFTLIEVIVGIAIITLLVVLGIPTISSMDARGKSAKCLSNLRQIGVGLHTYLGDHDQRIPFLEAGRRSTSEDVDVIDTALAPYVDNPATFHCPADSTFWRETGTSYFWNVALNGQVAHNLSFLHIADVPTRIPVISDKEGWHRNTKGRVNLLFADGHASSDLQFFVQK